MAHTWAYFPAANDRIPIDALFTSFESKSVRIPRQLLSEVDAVSLYDSTSPDDLSWGENKMVSEVLPPTTPATYELIDELVAGQPAYSFHYEHGGGFFSNVLGGKRKSKGRLTIPIRNELLGAGTHPWRAIDGSGFQLKYRITTESRTWNSSNDHYENPTYSFTDHTVSAVPSIGDDSYSVEFDLPEPSEGEATNIGTVPSPVLFQVSGPGCNWSNRIDFAQTASGPSADYRTNFCMMYSENRNGVSTGLTFQVSCTAASLTNPVTVSYKLRTRDLTGTQLIEVDDSVTLTSSSPSTINVPAPGSPGRTYVSEFTTDSEDEIDRWGKPQAIPDQQLVPVI